MSEFIRENRYIVIKRSDLDKLYKDPTKYATTFGHAYSLIAPHLPKRKFLVIESDWPEYEPAWQMIERRVSGLPDELTAAQSELAALREELAMWKGRTTNVCMKLAAAEQRNEALEDLVRRAKEWIAAADCNVLTVAIDVFSGAIGDSAERLQVYSPQLLADMRDALGIKPTESGASE